MTGSPASTLGSNSTLNYAQGAQGSVPTGQLSVGYGTFVINGATPVTVADANVTSTSVFVFSLNTVGGTVSPTAPNVLTKTAGTGFTVGGVASDSSTYAYVRFG